MRLCQCNSHYWCLWFYPLRCLCLCLCLVFEQCLVHYLCLCLSLPLPETPFVTVPVRNFPPLPLDLPLPLVKTLSAIVPCFFIFHCPRRGLFLACARGCVFDCACALVTGSDLACSGACARLMCVRVSDARSLVVPLLASVCSCDLGKSMSENLRICPSSGLFCVHDSELTLKSSKPNRWYTFQLFCFKDNLDAWRSSVALLPLESGSLDWRTRVTSRFYGCCCVTSSCCFFQVSQGSLLPLQSGTIKRQKEKKPAFSRQAEKPSWAWTLTCAYANTFGYGELPIRRPDDLAMRGPSTSRFSDLAISRCGEPLSWRSGDLRNAGSPDQLYRT